MRGRAERKWRGPLRGRVLTFAMAFVCLSGAGARAGEDASQPTSSIEIGAFYNSESSFKFGDYNGLEKSGGYFLGNLDIRRRDAWDSGGTTSWRLRGLNLGLDSRYADFEYWDQGSFRVFLLYDQLPKLQTDSASFPFLGLGSSSLSLPAGWVPGDTPADMSELSASLTPFGIGHQRERIATGLSTVLPGQFDLNFRFDRETRKGTKLVGGVIGSNGGNPRQVTIPEQIDYVTYDFDAALNYTGEKAQAKIGYYLSSFDSLNNSLTWENPYTAPAGGNTWAPAAAFPTGSGRKSTAPDNWFHQIRAAGGLTLPMNTRLTGNAAFGWMLQNESFLPFTVNPGLVVPTGLPRSSLDGSIRTTLLNFRATSKPLRVLRLRGEYTYDDRDNNTPRDTYIYVPGDSQNQGLVDGSTARVNRPYSYSKHHTVMEAKLASLSFLPRTQLTTAYEWTRENRDLQEVDRLDEHLFRADLRARPLDTVSTGAKYEYSSRTGSDYEGTASQVAGFSPEHLASFFPPGFDPATDFENHPLLRKYYLADRTRHLVKGYANATLCERVDLGFNVQWVRDDYNNTTVGLTEHERLSTTVDVSVSPMEGLRTYAFYTFERIEANQNGWSFGGGGGVAQSMDPTRRWSTEDEDTIHTVGVGVEMDLIEDRLSAGVDYLYSHSDEGLGVKRGTSIDGSPLGLPFPSSETALHDLSIHTLYKVRDNLKFRLGYLYEKFDSSDWQLDGVAPDSPTRVLAAGNTSPDYNVHLVSASLILEFE